MIVNINYEISAKEVGDGTIDESNIKLYLTEIVDGEEHHYRLRMYVDESYNPQEDGTKFNPFIIKLQ